MQQTSEFAGVAARWLEKWGELITLDDRKDPQRLLYRLIQYLCENRYLVQMDSLRNKPFEGNVLAYWNKYGNEVEEVEKAIAEAQEGNSVGADDKWQLDRFTGKLRRNVRSRLNRTFRRLQEDAKWAT